MLDRTEIEYALAMNSVFSENAHQSLLSEIMDQVDKNGEVWFEYEDAGGTGKRVIVTVTVERLPCRACNGSGGFENERCYKCHGKG